MSINVTKWIFLIFCFFWVPSLRSSFIPFPLSPLHLESTLLGVKDLLFILFGFPKQASLRDKSPVLSEPFVTLGFTISMFCLCVHSRHWCAHPRFAEQNNIWSLYFFLPKFSLEISRFCPTDTPCPQTRQHALNFHLRNKKIKWRAFFQTFLLERIRVPSCNTTQNSACLLQYQYKWILLQKLRLLFFFLGTTVSRMHVREYDLLHGVAVSRFAYSCFFLLLGIAFTLWSSFVQQRKSCEVQSMTLTDFCSYRHPNNH